MFILGHFLGYILCYNHIHMWAFSSRIYHFGTCLHDFPKWRNVLTLKSNLYSFANVVVMLGIIPLYCHSYTTTYLRWPISTVLLWHVSIHIGCCYPKALTLSITLSLAIAALRYSTPSYIDPSSDLYILPKW